MTCQSRPNSRPSQRCFCCPSAPEQPASTSVKTFCPAGPRRQIRALLGARQDKLWRGLVPLGDPYRPGAICNPVGSGAAQRAGSAPWHAPFRSLQWFRQAQPSTLSLAAGQTCLSWSHQSMSDNASRPVLPMPPKRPACGSNQFGTRSACAGASEMAVS